MARVLVLGGIAGSLIGFRGSLIRRMVENGHEVYACAPPASERTLSVLEDMGAIYREAPLDRAGIHPLRDLASLEGLVRLMREVKPDSVLAYNIKPVIYGSLAAARAKVPRIFSMITGLGYAFSDSGLMSRALGLVARRMYRSALRVNEKVFFQNPDDRSLFAAQRLLRADEQAVLINGSGVELDRYEPAPYPEQVVFLLIARLMRPKGIDEFVAAARIVRRSHPDVGFHILGRNLEGPDAYSEAEIAGWKAAGVDYLGFALDVRPVIAGASVFTLPSYYREGTPRSVLEALSMARPVITTDTPGCRETVEQGVNGLLVPPRDVDSLVAAMEYFVDNRQRIEEMGQASRRLAERKYDVNEVNAVILGTMGLE